MVQIAVIGLGDFGYKLATSLHDFGAEVIAIDKKEELVDRIKDSVAQSVQLDATKENALRDIGISEVDAGVVAIGTNVEENIMVTTLLRRMGVTRIIARAMSNLHEKILDEVGASKIIRIEEQMGDQIARWLVAPHVLQQVKFSSGYTLVEMKPKKEFIGKKVCDLQLREQYKVNIAALQKRILSIDDDGKSIYKIETRSPPTPDEIVNEDDILVLVGMDAAIYAITK
ncbi:MAG: TrkA family potassium uptake protein [Deltaproteobacteria bacterium]|nr:TrkA family potassium uptake protein [Deltaproteobacteria bacterium]